MLRQLSWSGIGIVAAVIAPLLYVATVLLGGSLTPGYSHVADPISALVERTAPAMGLINFAFAIYNLLLLWSASAMGPAFAQRGVHISFVGPVALGMVAGLGVVMEPFPMDPIGAASTVSGTIHIAIAGLQSFFTIIGMSAMGLSLRSYPAWRAFARYTGMSAILVIASGMAAAWMAATMSPLMGIAERVTIGSFLQWVFVLAVRLTPRPVPNEVA